VNAIEEAYPLLKVSTQMMEIRVNSKVKKKVQLMLSKNIDLASLDEKYPMLTAAITNALVYETRNKWASILTHKKLVHLLYRSYIGTYEQLIDLISDNNYDNIIFFNGRFIHEKALWAACETLSIKKTIFECLRDRYVLFDEGPHERFSIQIRMQKYWRDALEHNKSASIEIASEYFESLVQSKINRFVPKVTEEISQHFDFSFFTNSDDEAIGLGKDWLSPIGDNFQITIAVIKLFESGKFGTLAIKIHPNLINKAKEEQKIWSQLSGNRFVKIFNSQSKISSIKYILK
jgi:hypothetical protein